jgi:ribosome recycling factor
VRNARREANEAFKKREKAGELGQDDARRGEEQVQRLTDDYIGRIDEQLKKKEHEIMEV